MKRKLGKTRFIGFLMDLGIDQESGELPFWDNFCGFEGCRPWSDLKHHAEIWYYLPNGKGFKVTDNLDRLCNLNFGGVA